MTENEKGKKVTIRRLTSSGYDILLKKDISWTHGLNAFVEHMMVPDIRESILSDPDWRAWLEKECYVDYVRGLA